MNIVYVLVDPQGTNLTTMTWLSVQTLKLLHADWPITVFLDKATYARLSDDARFFDVELIAVDAEGETPMVKSRWIKTRLISMIGKDFLFLDSDTLVLKPLDELLDMPGELLAAVDANEDPAPLVQKPLLRSFFETMRWPVGELAPFNSGVFRVRMTSAVSRLGKLWPLYWEQGLHQNAMDQPSFWTSLHQSGVAVKVLPPQWNALVMHNPKLMKSAKIAHFWRSTRLGGSLLEELIETAESTNAVDWPRLRRAQRYGLPWRKDADAWQYWKSGHWCRAALAKIRRRSKAGSAAPSSKAVRE